MDMPDVVYCGAGWEIGCLGNGRTESRGREVGMVTTSGG